MQQSLFYPVLLFAFFFTSCSGNRNKTAAEAGTETPTAPKSAKTANHILVPNSHLYIIPPPGFAANEMTGTITTEEGHPDILVMKIISGTTPEIVLGQLKEEADKRSPGSWKEEELLVGGHKAKIYHSNGMAGPQYYLAFTDGYTDEMIVVNYDDGDPATGKQLYDALQTVVAEK